MYMRILIAENQPKVRFALRLLLEQQPEVERVGEARDAEELIAQLKIFCPDLVLIAWELTGLQTVDALPLLRRACPEVVVIALSGRPEARQVCLTAGADSFVYKGDPPDRLLAAIDDCCRRQK